LQSHLTAQNIKISDISKNTSATSSVNNVSYPVKGTRLQVSVAFAKLAVAKVHSKIRRVRKDFLDKLSRQTINENQVIVVENRAVKNMVKNHNLATSISDAGWGMFCTMLTYKAESEGKIYLEVGRFVPSTHL
jgi:IS605 OrfB family transposase